jgi:fluoroacetyl-CoA thioesterase
LGLAHELSWEVKPEHVPGHVPAAVLSTPSLVAFIEGTCRRAALDHLDPGHETVGVHICVSHEGTAHVGESVAVAIELVRIERRRLTFEVHVRGPRGDVSRGTHQRVVVDAGRFR